MKRGRIDVRHVLCPVDFSVFSARALDHAVRLARHFDADLHVLHVVPVVLDVVEPFPPVLPDLMAPVVAAAEDELRRFVAPARERYPRIRSAVTQGAAASRIEELAADLPADIVVMGTHGRTGLGRAVLGSVTESVMHHVECPVLAVSDRATSADPGPPFHRILCAADLRASSGATVSFALALAGENDADLELLHVVESLPPDASSANPSISTPELDAFRSGQATDARTRLGDAALEAASWCRVTTRVATGDAWRAIVERARASAADLIVVGAHAGPLRRALFGSTAGRVVRTAPCPVLVLRTPSPRDAPADARAVAPA